MVVRICTPFLHVLFASMHAPHRAHSKEHRMQWWHRIACKCHELDKGDSWILAFDGKIRVGSCTSESIGDWEADLEDELAQAAHSFFRRLKVFLPSTFRECMHGPGGTLSKKDPDSWIGQTLSLFRWNGSANAPPHGLTLSVAEVRVAQMQSKTRRHARIPIDAAAIRDPANRARISHILSNIPMCDWEMNVHEHAAAVVSFLQKELASRFHGHKTRAKPSFVSGPTAGLHKALATTRSKLRQRCTALRLARMRCAFYTWKQHRRADNSVEVLDFCARFYGRWMASLRCNIALDICRVGHFSAVLRRSSRQDKAEHISRLADDLKDAPPSEVHAAFKILVRPARKTAGKTAPLPRLRKLDGSFCQDHSEVQQRCREHFSMLEAGLEVSPQELIQNCADGQDAREPYPGT